MSYTDRTVTKNYTLGHRDVEIVDVVRSRECPITGQVYNQQVISRDVSLTGFNEEEAREFMSLLTAGDYRGINRRFG